LIASRAGVSKATLYVYFQSKEALLIELVQEECRHMPRTPIWEAGAGPLNVEEALHQIATKFTAFFLTDHGLALHHLVMVYAARFPEIGQIFYAAGPRKVHEQVAEFLRAAHAQGKLAIPDIDLAVTQFLSLVRGDLPLNRALSMPRPSKAELDNLIEGGIRVFLTAYSVADIR
jgi:TetR/AcrR family transcriptional repressor of mexJK operon